MTDTQMRSFMQDFFEQYYQRLGQDGDGIALLRPLEESDRAMWREDADPDEEWKVWKLIPSTVTDQDIEKLETDIGAKLPRCLRAFLTVYHHYFDGPVGVNPISAPFEAVRNAWNPLLVKHGYLPFTWDDDGYYIRSGMTTATISGAWIWRICRMKSGAGSARSTMRFSSPWMKILPRKRRSPKTWNIYHRTSLLIWRAF